MGVSRRKCGLAGEMGVSGGKWRLAEGNRCCLEKMGVRERKWELAGGNWG